MKSRILANEQAKQKLLLENLTILKDKKMLKGEINYFKISKSISLKNLILNMVKKKLFRRKIQILKLMFFDMVKDL